MGVICPMVNTRAAAEALVQYAKYPPRGARSNGPIRAAMYGEASNYQATANDETIVLPMIETREAVENMDEILDVHGISGIYVGPSDLAFSYGKPPTMDHEDKFFLEIYEKLIAACNKRGIYAGIHTECGTYAARMIKMGFRLTTLTFDSSLMARAAMAEIGAARRESGGVA
jgi:4-hydroxy-2-oxoheptanedioate aldolase